MSNYARVRFEDDYFDIIKIKTKSPVWLKRIHPLEYHLEKIDLDNYYIYKKTAHFREVTKEQFLEFKYAGYMFFNKDLYCNQEINEWIVFLKTIDNFMYMNKPFPPKEIRQKIKIKK